MFQTFNGFREFKNYFFREFHNNKSALEESQSFVSKTLEFAHKQIISVVVTLSV